LKAQLLPELKARRRLKRGAVPSLFSLGYEPKKARINSEARENRRHEEELPQEVAFDY